jgi:hypothetical protein
MGGLYNAAEGASKEGNRNCFESAEGKIDFPDNG